MRRRYMHACSSNARRSRLWACSAQRRVRVLSAGSPCQVDDCMAHVRIGRNTAQAHAASLSPIWFFFLWIVIAQAHYNCLQWATQVRYVYAMDTLRSADHHVAWLLPKFVLQLMGTRMCVNQEGGRDGIACAFECFSVGSLVCICT
jgi:hypothetical protein